MSPVIRISDNLHKRLEQHAIGFDTPTNVIERLLNEIEGVETITQSKKVASENNNTLPITLEPKNVDEFKELLLKKQSAQIKIFYNDESTEIKPWNASRFTQDSGVIANLRSRKEFRQGAWQALGIREILVSIKDIEKSTLESINEKLHKIEVWAKKPSQYNSKIIKIYLENSDRNSGIDKSYFLSEIEKQKIPINNYNQMRTNGENSNGLIFIDEENKIVMTEDSYSEALKYFKN